MAERRRDSEKAYLKESFLMSASARPLRILSEYLEPRSRFEHYRVEDTIVFMGSARLLSREPMKPDTLLQLCIEVPTLKNPILMMGKVRWCKSQDEHAHQIGIQFIGSLPPKLDEMLQALSQPRPQIA